MTVGDIISKRLEEWTAGLDDPPARIAVFEHVRDIEYEYALVPDLDATWDPPLERAGFPVNLKWDGCSDTLNAVKPIEKIVHDSAGERDEYAREMEAGYSVAESEAYARFVREFNAWLDRVRAGGA